VSLTFIYFPALHNSALKATSTKKQMTKQL